MVTVLFPDDGVSAIERKSRSAKRKISLHQTGKEPMQSMKRREVEHVSGHAMTHGESGREPKHYRRLMIMVAVSFAAMYGLMYAMVDSIGNVYASFNQIYMAGLMTAAMVIIELMIMGQMYPNKRLNAVLMIASAAALALFWFGIREQVGISDRQFLRSMIPHHAGAILMCEEAPIRDPAVRQLCTAILASQQAEIAQMKAMLGDKS